MARASVRLQAAATRGRVARHPQHTFMLRQRPFEITPFLIAPVLPGETLKNILFQMRIQSDPINNRLTGWWAETFWFYIKHRDLDERDTLTAMMLDPSTSVAAMRLNGGDTWKYVADDDIDWTGPCLKRVVEEYFRDQGEAWNTYVITAGRPAAKLHQNSWLDSVVDRTTILVPDDTELLDISAQTTIAGSDDKLMASELDAAMRQWQFLRDANLTNQTYEDFLATYGVHVAKVEPHKPELIRETHQWAYPVSAIDPSNGAAVSALQWSISERLDKDRFFTEPGFIFAVSVIRPKVYMEKQIGAAVGMMDNAFAWLPAIMNDDPATSLKEITATDGPLQDTTHNYVVDIRDILLYGDQFCNYAPTTAGRNGVALPNAALSNKKYPASTDVDDLFVDETAGLGKIETDGVASITILGKQVDAT